jgi:hypothetical protein
MNHDRPPLSWPSLSPDLERRYHERLDICEDYQRSLTAQATVLLCEGDVSTRSLLIRQEAFAETLDNWVAANEEFLHYMNLVFQRALPREAAKSQMLRYYRIWSEKLEECRGLRSALDGWRERVRGRA